MRGVQRAHVVRRSEKSASKHGFHRRQSGGMPEKIHYLRHGDSQGGRQAGEASRRTPRSRPRESPLRPDCCAMVRRAPRSLENPRTHPPARRVAHHRTRQDRPPGGGRSAGRKTAIAPCGRQAERERSTCGLRASSRRRIASAEGVRSRKHRNKTPRMSARPPTKPCRR